ncbi:coiled-coil domain-containing protein 152 [Sphaerodactylus townsendi]|uniref:coiled-coil domain-containing protein 152 n=1 Tax=Sphaerodactylus townsendi TaxID=933632 RepID=UPI002026F894|nr:coiled-coil domain-containing protein 152 [Sphaerodactylus townsendi]
MCGYGQLKTRGVKKMSAVNLDKLLDDFSHIEKKISELHAENNLLTLQLEKANKMLTITQSQEKSAKEECAILQNMVKRLQQAIENQHNVRDENERLKNTACMLEEKVKSCKQEYESQLDRLVKELESKEEEHKFEQKNTRCEMNKRLETKEEEHKQLIEKKDLEISELTRQLRVQEKEKQNEIIKLQIEFDAKLTQLQKRTPKSRPDPSALPQNIYRRKLQHFQEEKNKEIEALRNTIRDLEQRLSKDQDVRPRKWKI